MDGAGFGKLGFYNLSLVSIFCALGGLLSTSVTSKIGINFSLFLGAIMNAAWIATSILPTLKSEETDPDVRDNYIIYSQGFVYSIMLLASCIAGFTTGLLWTS